MSLKKPTPQHVVDKRLQRLSGPFVVCEMINNVPIFSRKPYQHTTYDGAATEVNRLQLMHPFKHFRIMGIASDHPMDRARPVTVGEVLDSFVLFDKAVEALSRNYMNRIQKTTEKQK